MSCSPEANDMHPEVVSLFAIATDSAPGRPNEDFVIATPSIAVVVDGAGIAYGGCHHGIAWFSRQLASRTLTTLLDSPDVPLTDALAAGIEAVANQHRHTCDLTDPGTPCAAVGILRVGPQNVDMLSLSDVTVVTETTDGPVTTCDLAIEEISGTEPTAVMGLTFGMPEHDAALAQLVERQTASRNRVGGWWVAAADPEAAYHAQTMSVPASARSGCAAVLSDGATRPVDQMAIYGWPEYLELLSKLGPDGLIAHVRGIESSDPDGARYPRTKRHDDASVAVIGTV
jgi:hypothetical protein